MSNKLKLLVASLVCCVALSPAPATAQSSLQGDVRLEPNSAERPTDLFQGDLGAEIGIGCSNPSGTSGGPNDCAVNVTSPIATPFDVTSHYYNIFTNVSPTITALTFTVWRGGFLPTDPPFGRQSGLDFASGDHTVSIAPAISVGSRQFFFGHSQPQTDAALRWGLDTSSGGGSLSFIRAPGCGLSSWGTLSSIGFAGNWVMSVSVVGGGGVPIELTTWGQVKQVWNSH